jgi:hypothetical protein
VVSETLSGINPKKFKKKIRKNIMANKNEEFFSDSILSCIINTFMLKKIHILKKNKNRL